MTRYFYTDTLAAAWIAKHFEMRSAPEGEDVLTPAEEVCSEAAARAALDEPANWYIHSDSLHLLEPRVGDRLSDGYLVVYNHPSPKTYQRRLHLVQSDLRKGKYRIIQRGDKTYFWPERED